MSATSSRRRDLGVFGLFGEVAGRGECPAPAPFTRSKRMNSRTKVPVRPAEGPYCLGTATLACRGAHQTSMLHGCAELPDHIDYGHTAETTPCWPLSSKVEYQVRL